jgi:hypothetical protein
MKMLPGSGGALLLALVAGCQSSAVVNSSPSAETAVTQSEAAVPAVVASAQQTAAPESTTLPEVAVVPPTCSDSQVLIQGACAPAGSAVIRASFGRGDGQLGVYFQDRKDWYGPTDLLALDQDTIWVLDSSNRRLVLFVNGQAKRSLPLATATFTRVVRLADGRLVLYDHGAYELDILAPDGQAHLARRFSDVDGVKEAQYLEVRPDGVWVGDWGQRQMVGYRLLDEKGGPVAAPEAVSGYPSWDGESVVQLGFSDSERLSLKLTRGARGSEQPVVQTLRLPGKRTFGTELRTDAKSYVYVGRDFIPQEGTGLRRDIHVFDSQLRLLRRHELPVGGPTWEMYRLLEVTANGEVFVLDLEGEQVVVRRY